MATVVLRGHDPRLRFRGAVSLQRGPDDAWVAPWRVPHDEASLHLPAGGLGRAAMPAGVRIALRTDARGLRCRYRADPAPRLNGPQEPPNLDLLVDGGERRTVRLDTTGDEAELRLPLPGRPALVELWLPSYHQFRLAAIELEDAGWVDRDDREPPPWVHYGSSISQGRGAASPSRAWTARVARGAGLDLTSLALGAACHMQPMTARLMRDQPAALLSACVGINSQALGALNGETFLAAAIGFVRTVREAHPTTPFVLMSTTWAPEREDVPGDSGLTIRDCRALTARAVELLRAHGDRHLHHLDGLAILGPDDGDLFLEPPEIERLHPSPAGHVVVAERFLAALRGFGALPAPAVAAPA
ncbi:GDSL-type esterase/lipase family protein [Patulibacter defluvii]|uniref:GDSL-type esterase/lipase family protein n=1 Tax=Patulibacter defluvii TaxID=3095358 RepID=UPI002A75EBE7|nr:GDSL-type esterase/lipase family protein [Patulibacter sp. DM4]